MKNLMKSAWVALAVGVFALPAAAESYVAAPANVQDTVVKKDSVVKKDAAQIMMLAKAEVTYTKIKVSDLPQAVAQAVAEKYKGYTVEEVAKGSDNNYKLVIKKGTETKTVYLSGTGECVKGKCCQGCKKEKASV